MSRLDSQIGELLEVLRKSGKFENTLIVYLGDHGADMLRGKRTCFEGGLRIPLIMSGGTHWKEGERCSELVSTIDLMPTLLEMAGVSPPGELPGRSLVSLLNGENAAWRRHLFAEFHLHSAHNYYPQRSVRDDRFKLIHNLMAGEINPGYEFTLQRFFKGVEKAISVAGEPVRGAYQRMRHPPEFELYDLENDPYEFENLEEDPDHAEAARRLKKRLLQWRISTKDPLLDRKKALQLKAEIEACMKDGTPRKADLKLNYREYFFDESR